MRWVKPLLSNELLDVVSDERRVIVEAAYCVACISQNDRIYLPVDCWEIESRGRWTTSGWRQLQSTHHTALYHISLSRTHRLSSELEASSHLWMLTNSTVDRLMHGILSYQHVDRHIEMCLHLLSDVDVWLIDWLAIRLNGLMSRLLAV